MKQQKKYNYGIIAAIYLAGIFMGAIDTGIVTPARTIIQNNLMVSDKAGIWMITIYTLAYAASIPIMGKLADKYGRKYVYLTSIFLFGVGSLFCGLSQDFGSFTALLIARVIQALGGGGIMPVATAEFGTAFPAEKRGLALGLVGGVYGIANIFGSSAGSAILDIFGMNNWQFIFYINLPITVFILIAGFICLSNNRAPSVKKTDVWGILLLTSMVLSLMYGLKNIDFFNFVNTLKDINVYLFLVIFVVMLPFFILAEKKAEDPIMNLSYFTDQRILTTLILSFVVGIVMMGMIFVPQFSENALKISSGKGGYFVIILGLFAGVGAPMSGKLIDKFGAKIILALGFIISAIGASYLIFITTNYPNTINVIISLVLIGLGMGFTIGTPLNYMMLENTKKEESNSALATLSLVRSIGTAIAPAIMIGFISHAGANIQTNITDLLPKEVSVSKLPYADELTDKINKYKQDPNMKDKIGNIEMPDLTSMTTIKIEMSSNSDYKMPNDLVELMKSSDVTTITENSKTLANRMFAEMTPKIIKKIQDGVQKGIDGITNGISEMDKAIYDLQKGYIGVSKGIKEMQTAIHSQRKALKQIETVKVAMSQMQASKSNNSSISKMPANVSMSSMMTQNVNRGVAAQMPNQAKNMTSVKDLDVKINQLKAVITSLEVKVKKAKKDQKDMIKAIKNIEGTQSDIKDTVNKMKIFKNAVPGAFTKAKNDYIKAIGNERYKLEISFQKTLNYGFKQVYLTVAIASLFALFILAFYKKKNQEEASV